MREGVRRDFRKWRQVLAEYRVNAGSRVKITLPELKFMEDRDEREGERERECAAAA